MLLPVSALAQDYATDQGSVRLGGSASFISQGGDLYEDGGERANTVLVNPSLQYFIFPGLAIGADALVNAQSQDDFSQTTLSIGPSASLFFGGAKRRVHPFVTASPLFSRLSVDLDDVGDVSIDGFGAQFSGGAAFMLARNVALTAEFFYLTESLTPENTDNSVDGNTYGIQVGVAAFVF